MSLEGDALRLRELDQQLVRAVREGDIDAFRTVPVAYVELLESLKTALLDKTAISVADIDAAEVLRKIGSGEGLLSDTIIARLRCVDPSPDDYSEEELWELGSELFYSWYSHSEYVTALAQLRPLILYSAASEDVSRLVWKAKQCYAFLQYDAVCALCRALLEASSRDICVRCELFPGRNEDDVRYGQVSWRELQEEVSCGRLRNKLKGLYGRLSVVVHGRQRVNADRAREMFGETLEVIEQLYDHNEL